jgi:hypothetical protein
MKQKHGADKEMRAGRIVGDGFAEAGDGLYDITFDRNAGNAHGNGNFFVLHAFEAAEPESFLLLGRQQPDGLLDGTIQLTQFRGFLRAFGRVFPETGKDILPVCIL